MFRFREFRQLCKDAQSEEIIEMMSSRLNFEAIDDYYLCTSYLSELINKNDIQLDPALLNFLYSFSKYESPEIKFRKNSKRLGIFIKNQDGFPVQLLSCINRIYIIPIVILLGKNQQNTDFAASLKEIDIAAKVIDYGDDLEQDLKQIKTVCEEEKLSKAILHANPADLEFMLVARKYKEEIITFHCRIPLISEFTYCEQEGSLGKGSWKSNKGLPLYDYYSAIYIPAGLEFPKEVFKSVKHEKIILLNPTPLECLKTLSDEEINKINFISEPSEYNSGLKFCSELIVIPGCEEECLDLAIEWGLSLRFLKSNKHCTFDEVKSKYSLTQRFSQVLSKILGNKASHRKVLPRILFFRNDKAAPIIKSINQNISAALKHAGCPLLEINLIPMINASKEKDWQKLTIIQQDLRDQIDHFNPDQALGYNDTGIFPNGDSHMLEQMSIPFNGLFFDNPFYFMHNLKFCKNKQLVRIFTLDEYYIPPLKEGGFINTHYMPIATSIQHRSLKVKNRFNPNKFIFTATVKQKFNADNLAQEVDNKNDKGFIKYAFNQINETECFSIPELFESYKHFYTKDYIRFQNEIWFKIDNQCSSILRLKTIEALEDFEVDIYGGNNWEKVKLSHKHTYLGYMNYTNLPDAYNTALGTICRTPLNIQNGIQQRILDCGAAQGLIISDYRPILEEHFELDKELFVYRNCDELVEKVKFLKNNPKAVEKSKKLLHKKVLKQHTWDLRIKELISYMR